MENTYEKSGCYECAMSDSEWGFVNDKYILIKRTCKKGNTDQLIQWWENNKHKRSKDELEPMECHEYSESTKNLIRISGLLKEVKTILHDENGKPK